MLRSIVIIGANGAIGRACLHQLKLSDPNAIIYAYSRTIPQVRLDNVYYHEINYSNESEIAISASQHDAVDLVIVATGMLHDANTTPEKSLDELQWDNMQKLFEVNTFMPALILKHFAPKLRKGAKSVLAVLSARVGSISDNRLGGWYSYRMSKAALNMLIKTTAIEIARLNKSAIIVGLHPGTVASALSQPFQKNIPQEKLFTPEYSAELLSGVIDRLSSNDSGLIFDWSGQEIMP